MKKLLIANRGECAIRIARAAFELGIETVGVFAEDDATALHVSQVSEAHPLQGMGPTAYLDHKQLVSLAQSSGCDDLHPGIGFLSESPVLASACAGAGVRFVGPDAAALALFGDKVAARALAQSNDIPVLLGSPGPLGTAELADARGFFSSLPQGTSAMIKAVAGGGGRGMQVVENIAQLDEALQRCSEEALAAFGDGALYMEQYLPHARHVEVQLVSDGRAVAHLGTRDCTLQRRHQKLLEIAPAPWLSAGMRATILDHAVRLGKLAPFVGVATVEFLLASDGPDNTGEQSYFMEVNPRLQVEHTITEEITGVDLVQTQLQLAAGASLDELGLLSPPITRGVALQARVNMERLQPDGQVLPSSGTLGCFSMPSGPGVRVDAMGYVGYRPSAMYDSLLAKVIVSGPQLERAFSRGYRALCETQIEGIETNLALLKALMRHPDVHDGKATTTFVTTHAARLVATANHPQLFPDSAACSSPSTREQSAPHVAGPTIPAPMDGTIVECLVAPDEVVVGGQALVVMSAMKMEHVIAAPGAGTVGTILVAVAETVQATQPLLVFRHAADASGAENAEARLVEVAITHIRGDLEALQQRHARKLDAARPKAVEKRHKRGFRTARENIADLCDEDSFVEYGGLVLAAQRGTSDVETLIDRSPADGIIVGVATVNAPLFGPSASKCAVLSYDYTVFAGTQGYQGHRKTDRLLHVAKEARLPVIFFTEGGGGRPNDTDLLDIMISGLECASFREFASLQGVVPLVGINHGRCFAGNAALLGCCDVIIATENSNIGMGGPAMIEGGGLGIFRPEEVGPLPDHIQSGVVDIAVKDEAEAVAVAKQYLSYFQGAQHPSQEAADQRLLRHCVPENRLRVYDVHRVIDALADQGSVMELRPDYAPGMLTALARLEGRSFGIIANNPAVMAGAIDTPGAGKATRFMTLCEQFGLPLLFLCDTPGIMVGPEAEKSGTVRAAAAMFVAAARLTIPFGTIVLRKGYGLGAQAMAGGHFKAPRFLVSWPTGEFGPMGIEGAVKLGFRRQLEAIVDPQEREDMFNQMVAMLYERGKATNIASHFEIDDVIDPADSRTWLRTLFS